jgi:hypothetical protein
VNGLTEVPQYCEHRNFSTECRKCHDKSLKPIVSDNDDHLTEQVRCKRCDSENRADPKKKKLGCKVCLYVWKDKWPKVDFENSHGSELKVQFRKFRREHWREIPKQRQRAIEAGMNLSEEYSKFYQIWLNHLRRRPGFNRSPSKNHIGIWYIRE